MPRLAVDMYQVTTSEHRQEIRNARAGGWTLDAISAACKEQGFDQITATIIKEICGDATTPRQNNVGRAGSDPARKAAIVAAVLAGATAREAARQFGCSTATVWQLTRHLDGKRAPGGPKADPEKVRAACEDYTKGRPLAYIEDRHQISAQSLYNWLAAAGIARRSNRGRPANVVSLKVAV